MKRTTARKIILSNRCHGRLKQPHRTFKTRNPRYCVTNSRHRSWNTAVLPRILFEFVGFRRFIASSAAKRHRCHSLGSSRLRYDPSLRPRQSLKRQPATQCSALMWAFMLHLSRKCRTISPSRRTLAVPRTRTTYGDRSFAVAGPRVWNSLPATIRQIVSYRQFSQHLKTHLFRP